jgi:hypothetical protein
MESNGLLLYSEAWALGLIADLVESGPRPRISISYDLHFRHLVMVEIENSRI